ncbi:MAG: hypothetical protein IPM61_16490 [Chlorobi bacterium]|nr:hypothetical protein [Chlorobiota bacterium]
MRANVAAARLCVVWIKVMAIFLKALLNCVIALGRGKPVKLTRWFGN